MFFLRAFIVLICAAFTAACQPRSKIEIGKVLSSAQIESTLKIPATMAFTVPFFPSFTSGEQYELSITASHIKKEPNGSFTCVLSAAEKDGRLGSYSQQNVQFSFVENDGEQIYYIQDKKRDPGETYIEIRQGKARLERYQGKWNKNPSQKGPASVTF